MQKKYLLKPSTAVVDQVSLELKYNEYIDWCHFLSSLYNMSFCCKDIASVDWILPTGMIYNRMIKQSMI